VMSALAVASVIAASSTGTFFAVTGGLGILLTDSPGAPVAPQSAPASAPRVVTSTTPRHRQVPAPHVPSPSASVRLPATPTAHPAGTVKPAPPVTVSPVPPLYSPRPQSSPSATISHSPLPSVTASAEPTP
jgi:hypothetical protein